MKSWFKSDAGRTDDGRKQKKGTKPIFIADGASRRIYATDARRNPLMRSFYI